MRAHGSFHRCLSWAQAPNWRPIQVEHQAIMLLAKACHVGLVTNHLEHASHSQSEHRLTSHGPDRPSSPGTADRRLPVASKGSLGLSGTNWVGSDVAAHLQSNTWDFAAVAPQTVNQSTRGGRVERDRIQNMEARRQRPTSPAFTASMLVYSTGSEFRSTSSQPRFHRERMHGRRKRPTGTVSGHDRSSLRCRNAPLTSQPPRE